jgi:hypothetical protein
MEPGDGTKKGHVWWDGGRVEERDWKGEFVSWIGNRTGGFLLGS